MVYTYILRISFFISPGPCQNASECWPLLLRRQNDWPRGIREQARSYPADSRPVKVWEFHIDVHPSRCPKRLIRGFKLALLAARANSLAQRLS